MSKKTIIALAPALLSVFQLVGCYSTDLNKSKLVVVVTPPHVMKIMQSPACDEKNKQAGLKDEVCLY